MDPRYVFFSDKRMVVVPAGELTLEWVLENGRAWDEIYHVFYYEHNSSPICKRLLVNTEESRARFAEFVRTHTHIDISVDNWPMRSAYPLLAFPLAIACMALVVNEVIHHWTVGEVLMTFIYGGVLGSPFFVLFIVFTTAIVRLGRWLAPHPLALNVKEEGDPPLARDVKEAVYLPLLLTLGPYLPADDYERLLTSKKCPMERVIEAHMLIRKEGIEIKESALVAWRELLKQTTKTISHRK